jgi:hypothetical protein
MSKVKRIYLHKDSHLPEAGWLQSCFRCSSITGKCFLLQTFNKGGNLYEFYIYICARCKKKLTKSPSLFIEFSDEYSEHIRTNFGYLFSSRT